MLLGADPERLEELAGQFDSAAARLRDVYRIGRQAAGSPVWSGPDAQQFRDRWDGHARARLQEAERVLAAAARTLRDNAAAQRSTSEAGSGVWGSGSGFGGPGGGALPADGASRTAALRELAGRTPEQQLAWWRSLSDDDRRALLASSPGLLLAMTGLPPDVRAEANANAIADRNRSVAIRTDTYKVEAGGNVKIVTFGADGQIESKTFPDGHVEVTVKGGASVGAGLKLSEKAKAELDLKGEAAATYEFKNADEANRFTEGLLKAPLQVPHNAGDVWAAVASVGTLSPSAYAARQVSEYLGRFDAQRTSTVVGGELSGQVKVDFPGVGKVDLKDGTGIEYDTVKKETTVYVKASGSGEGHLGPYAGSVGAGGKIAVTYDEHGQVKDMTISGDYEAGAGLGVDGGVVAANSTAGTSGTFTMKVDLTDPKSAQAAMHVLTGTVSGDAHQVAQSFDQLRDGSEVVVEVSTKTHQEAGFDAVVADGKYTHDTTTGVATWIKPSYGEFGLARGDAGGTGAGGGAGGGGGAW